MKNSRKALLFMAAASLIASANIAAAPAPPVSYVQVRYVGSSTQGWKPVTDNQLTTSEDHGGPQLRVLTVEVGYSYSPFAQINGAYLPQSANYATVPFCNYSNFLEQCSPGQIVVGFVRYWNLDGYQGGSFWYQNNSIGDRMNIL
jgi:hypothetical protein